MFLSSFFYLIINQSYNNLTFDILIRDYFDTDANPVVIEKFTNCTMDPGQNSYVANKVGTLDKGLYSWMMQFLSARSTFSRIISAFFS